MTASPPFLCEVSDAEGTTDLTVRLTALGLSSRIPKLIDGCLCSGIVNLLCSAIG